MSQQGRKLFAAVEVSLGHDLHPWGGGERRGNFVVRSSEPIPDLRGERVQISDSRGSQFSAEITTVADDVVYFRFASAFY